MKNKKNLIIVLSIFSFLFSCDESEFDKKAYEANEAFKADSLKKLEQVPIDPYPVIHYRLDTIKDRKHLLSVLNEYSPVRDKIKFRVFTTLNRKELRFLIVGSAIVIPDSFNSDLKAYSVFPHNYMGADSIKKLILVSNRYMAYGCYENGKLVRFAAVNPGKERTPSFPGRYALNWKVREHRSSLDSHWIMPFTWNFHMQAGSAFHQFEMPGKPASHSCIRQFAEDAEWLYYWGRGIRTDSLGKRLYMSGTPVIIIDHYDFNTGKGNLWKYLNSNKDIVLKLPDDPMTVEEALIPIVQIPEVARGSLRNRKRFDFAEDTLRARGVIRDGVKLIVSVDFNKKRRLKAQKELQKKKQAEIEQPKSNQ